MHTQTLRMLIQLTTRREFLLTSSQNCWTNPYSLSIRYGCVCSVNWAISALTLDQPCEKARDKRFSQLSVLMGDCWKAARGIPFFGRYDLFDFSFCFMLTDPCKSMDQYMDRSMNPLVSQSVNQQLMKDCKRKWNQSVEQSTHQSSNQSIKRGSNQSMIPSANQLVIQSACQPVN